MKRTVSFQVTALAAAALLAGCTNTSGGTDQSSESTSSSSGLGSSVAAGSVAAPAPGAASTVALNLNGGGCDPRELALPAAPLTLRITNQAGSGEFDIQDAAGKSMAKVPVIDQGETKDLQVSLPTGYYTLECRTDDTTSMLTVGTPSEPPVDLGSVAAPNIPAAAGYRTADGNSYTGTNLVANSAAYDPLIVDPTMVDAWGLASRPAGAGGHFWIGANKTGSSMEYIGDVGKTPLHQGDLRIISVPGAVNSEPGAPPAAANLGQPTGVIFNPFKDKYVVDQGAVKAPAKFLFAGQDGTLSAWTEKDNPNGSVTQLAWATKVYDDSARDAQYLGLALSPDGSRLLVADFGPEPGIWSFDSFFKPVATQGFANPFVTAGKPVAPGDLLPWNVTTLGKKIYVSYAAVGADENDAKKPSTGEEAHQAGAGRVVEYDGSGKLVRVLDDRGSLDAPWGITMAPKGFGKLSGALLVANFGDGTISAFDTTGHFLDFLRGKDGKPLVTPGIWAVLPGNGASLGAADAVYFTAGPRAEADGVFGRIAAG